MKNVVIVDHLIKNQEFIVKNSENKTFLIFLTDLKNQQGDLKISIKGKKANVQILGIIIGSGDQQIKL